MTLPTIVLDTMHTLVNDKFNEIWSDKDLSNEMRYARLYRLSHVLNHIEAEIDFNDCDNDSNNVNNWI